MQRRSVVLVALGAAFCLVASQAALRPSLEGLLRRNLERQAAEYADLRVRVDPLGWFDVARGIVRGVEIRGRDISFGGLRLASLEMRLSRIDLAVGALLRHGEPIITSLGRSRVVARVDAAALNDYRRRAYPDVPAFFSLRAGRVGLAGSLRILGSDLSVRTAGDLRAVEGDRLRYIPEVIEVGGREVPLSWLAAYGEKLALDFPLVLPVPLALRGVRIGDGYLELAWTERG